MDLKETQSQWNRLGSMDPLYGVLSHEGKRGARWDEEEFFATGREEITQRLAQAEGRGYQIQKGRVLDFGCGVGRLSQALAEHFEKVVGLDIAPAMLERARAYNRFAGRCEYLLNEAPDLKLFGEPSFDFIYSHIVLQHMAPRFALAYISEFVRILKGGAYLAFQVPEKAQYSRFRLVLKTLLPKGLLRFYRRLRYGAKADLDLEIEMNGLSPKEVRTALEAAGAEVLEAKDGWYWARRIH